MCGPDVRSVMAGVQSSDVVNDGEQDVLVVRLSEEEVCPVPRPGVSDERRHVNDLWEVHPGGDLLVESAGVLEPLEVEGGDHRELL